MWAVPGSLLSSPWLPQALTECQSHVLHVNEVLLDDNVSSWGKTCLSQCLTVSGRVYSSSWLGAGPGCAHRALQAFPALLSGALAYCSFRSIYTFLAGGMGCAISSMSWTWSQALWKYFPSPKSFYAGGTSALQSTDCGLGPWFESPQIFLPVIHSLLVQVACEMLLSGYCNQ